MTRSHLSLLLALAPLLMLALGRVAARGQVSEPIGPQPELPKEPLVIVTRDGKAHRFDVEVANTPAEETVGLMFRKSLPPDGGMLFDWGLPPRESDMWMKNTLIPLDMLFINQDGRIRAIAENTVPQSLAPIPSHGPVRATLELPAGTAARLGIRVGDQVKQRVFGNAG